MGGMCNAMRMCRNIRPLNNFEPPATDDEVHAAALQYVRKIAGTTKPSSANQQAFDEAVDHIDSQLVPLFRKAAAAQGLRVAVLADIHASPAKGAWRTERIVEDVLAARPDLIVLPGTRSGVTLASALANLRPAQPATPAQAQNG